MADDLCRAVHPEQPVVHCDRRPHADGQHTSALYGIGWTERRAA